MKNFLKALFCVLLVAGIRMAAQSGAPEIRFDSAADPLKLPANNSIYLGEAAGVATNSKGDVFVFTRTGHPTLTLGGARAFAHGGSRLFQFDKSGKYIGEIGQGLYGFEQAQQVRVDPQDNIWVVDQMSSMIIKFDPKGQVQLLLGRKAEAERVPTGAPAAAGPANAKGGNAKGGDLVPPPGAAAAKGGAGAGKGRGGPPGAGQASDVFNRPTDVAWDSAGNIYVADGYGNSRIAKFDKNGKFVKSWGSRGTEQGQFNTPHGLAIDAQGNVYVADSGNKRVQVFDSEGNFKTQFSNVGSPAAICITPGARQVLYVSDSNPPEDIDANGEIYKVDLTGKVLGKFGRAGKLMKEFGTVNEIDCRTENDLYVGEIGNWRVQKLTLHP